MKSTDVSSSAWSWATRSSTSASTVASSPVVGSSRISSAGFFASAIAITTRCCMPPESWWGYRLMTDPRVGDLHALESIARARSRRLARRRAEYGKTSASCFPTRIDGLSAAPGFW